jgi:hypothetical protein
MRVDPTGDRTARVTSPHLREARSLLRRVDKLFAASAAMEDPATNGTSTEARRALERLVHHLIRLEQQRQRRARDTVRRRH